jgi:hypothetical protein
MNTKEQDLVDKLRKAPNLSLFLDYIAEKEAKLDGWKHAGDGVIKVMQGKAQMLDEIKRELSNGR